MDTSKFLEDMSSTISSEKVCDLITELFKKSEHTVSVIMHNYREDYDFYITVSKEKSAVISTKDILNVQENYRFKEKQIIPIVNQYLRDTFNIKIKQNDNNGSLPGEFHFSLQNKDTFFFRYE
jgi:ABC-type transporter Mla maintaining outer membrane lipid asymmetry ATPase subunit MlaF